MPKLMVVEWPDGLQPYGERWERIAKQIQELRPDVLLTNEMPFGDWLPSHPTYEPALAASWVELHERGLEALAALDVGAVLSSRPVHSGMKLANEAFALVDGVYTAHHHKQLFPQEPGWYESTWFESSMPGFSITEVLGIKVAFLVCTELMFNEHARHLGRAGADLIAVPRATGVRRDSWEVAAGMASLVGGCYVATSNRVMNGRQEGPTFGGHGFVIEPGGAQVAVTSPLRSMNMVKLDLAAAASAKQDYPCYVPETLVSSWR